MLHWSRSLKEMQNGLRTTGIGYNTVKMRVMCMFLELKLICNEVFWSANEFGNEFGVDDFWTRSTLFFKHMHAFSTTTLTGFVFCMMRFIFGSCQLFLLTVWMLLEFVQTVRLKRSWKWR